MTEFETLIELLADSVVILFSSYPLNYIFGFLIVSFALYLVKQLVNAFH